MLQRLDALLVHEVDPARRAALLSRKACYLARVGLFDQAQGIVAGLRRDYPQGSSPRASVWIMLAEGLIHTFRHLSGEGLDRIARAEVLAAAMRDRELTAWASAWLAHLQFERSEFTQMARLLDAAFANAGPDEHEALARASMVLANALAACGDFKRANEWYMACRYHAVEAGDEATLEAHLYNRAAFGISWLRAQVCLGFPDEGSVVAMRREIASAHNLQDLTGVQALTNMVVLWEARLSILQGDYERAVRLLPTTGSEGPFSETNFSPSIVGLERALCLARLGRVADAEREFLPASGANIDHLHEDEQMYAAWIRCELAQYGTTFDAKDAAEQRLASARRLFAEASTRLKSAIAPLSRYKPPTASILKVAFATAGNAGGMR